MIHHLINRLVDKKKTLAFFTIVLLFVMAFFSSIPKIDGKLDGLNFKQNKYYQAGKKTAAFFKINDFVEIKITPESTTTNKVIEGVRELEKQLKKQIRKSKCKSLHTFSFLFQNELLLDTTISIQQSLLAKKEFPMLANFISKDAKSFRFILMLDSSEHFDLTLFKHIINESYQGIKDLKSLSHFHIEEAIASSIQKDVLLIALLILILFCFIIYYCYRSIQAVLYCSIIILLSILPAFLCFSILDVSINLLTALVIPVVLILSLADAIHLLTGYYQSQATTKEDRIKESMNAYIIPSFITSLTTAIAFSSFLFNDAESIRNFGLIIAVSVMVSFFITYGISSYILSLIKPKQIPKNLIYHFFDFLQNKKRVFSIGLIILTLISIPLASQLSFNTNFDSFIPKNTEVLANRNELNRDFNSQLSIHLLVQKPTSQSLELFENRLTNFIDSTKSINGIGTVQSFKDVIYPSKEFNILAQIILNEQKSLYRNKDEGIYRLEIRLTDIKKLKDVTSTLEKTLVANNFTYNLYSQALILQETDRLVAKSLLTSLSLSLGLIFFVILTLTRSIKIMIISALVNLMPLSFLSLIFWIGHHDINVLTSIIVVICLGIIVDDTIHMIYRKAILERSENELGFSVISTSLVLVVGFLCFLVSSFEPCQVFGYVSALIFLITVITDLTLLPLLIDNIKRKKT